MTIGVVMAGLWLAQQKAMAATNEEKQSSVTSNDLTNLTLEQLVNIQVTSVSKKSTGSKPVSSCPPPSFA
jgi:hypothetical protein